MKIYVFFFQAEDGIRNSVASRGHGDVYKRQYFSRPLFSNAPKQGAEKIKVIGFQRLEFLKCSKTRGGENPRIWVDCRSSQTGTVFSKIFPLESN